MTPIEIIAPAISFLISLVTLEGLLRGRLAGLAMDQPNDRSLHVAPVPRSGGLAVMAGVLGGWFWLDLSELRVLVPLLLALLAISLLDDVRSLPARVRFAAHFVAAGVFCTSVVYPVYGAAVAMGCVLAHVWMTNLYNFMDGSDGLAGGMAAIGFSTLMLAALLHGDLQLAATCACIVVAALAFLRVNFHPARIFMGDSGSIPLGFSAAALGMIGFVRGTWDAWLPLLAFSMFIADASVTLARRLLRGERVWQAHRTHYYQRMVRMGYGHARTARLCYVAMACSGLAALLFQRFMPAYGLLPVLLCGLVYAVLARRIDRQWSAFESRQTPTAA